ncbi:TadE family type IV pilus minor pilin [Kribbella hippodromi]|uniref:TadE family type IV pilus minor pilin n=1 Tax=Kribbella hippodromi TaxID=434347 RepID=UPI0031DADEB4
MSASAPVPLNAPADAHIAATYVLADTPKPAEVQTASYVPKDVPLPVPVPGDVPVHALLLADARADDAPTPAYVVSGAELTDVPGAADRLNACVDIANRACVDDGGFGQQDDRCPQQHQRVRQQLCSTGVGRVRPDSRSRSRSRGRSGNGSCGRDVSRGRLSHCGSTDRGERGAVTAEFAIVLPMLLSLLLLGVWAIGLVVLNLQCIDAARDVARAVARGESPEEAQAIGQRAIPGGAVVVTRDGSDVRVTVSAVPSRTPPLLGRLFAPRLTATAVVQAEPETQ